MATELTKDLLDSHFKCRDIISRLSEEIFEYIKDSYVDYLAYNRRSQFDGYDLTEDELCIKYYDSSYVIHSYTWFEAIPVDNLINDTWKEFIDEHFNKLKLEENMVRVANELKAKKTRQKLYEQLKQEFEDNQ